VPQADGQSSVAEVKTPKERGKMSQCDGQRNSAGRMVAEAVVWGWMLAVLGYFYYTRGFFSLLRQIWEQVSG